MSREISPQHLGTHPMLSLNCHHPLIMSSCQSFNVWLFVSVFVTEDQIPHGFPTIDMGPQLKVVERTRTATMLCAASGNPDPEIYWFKDFLPVDISSSNGRIKQLRSGIALISTCSHTGLRSADSGMCCIELDRECSWLCSQVMVSHTS